MQETLLWVPVRTREAFPEKATGCLREFVADSFSFPSGCQEAHSQVRIHAPTAGTGLDEGLVPHSSLSDPPLPWVPCSREGPREGQSWGGGSKELT